MYEYFTAIIQDTLKTHKRITPGSNWDGMWLDVVHNTPEIRGYRADTDNHPGGSQEPYIFQSNTEMTDWVKANYTSLPAGTKLVYKIKHDKPLIENDYGCRAYFNGVGAWVDRKELNILMDGYYESWSEGIYPNEISVAQIVSTINMVTPERDQGEINVWDGVFYLVFGDDPENKIYLSTAEGIKEEGQDCLPYLDIRGSMYRGIDPSKSSASSGYMEMYIKNRKHEISKLLYKKINTDNTLFINERVDIYGYKENGEKHKLHTASIKDMTSDPFETEYNIELSDVFDRIKLSVFERELREYEFGGVVEDEAATQQRLPLDYGFIYEETGTGQDIVRKVSFTGHPVDCMFGLLQTMFSAPLAEIAIQWLTDDWIEFVDLKSINEVRDNDLSLDYYNNFYFEWEEPITDPFEWIKEQIFKPCRIFPFIDNQGRLAIKTHEQPQSSEDVLILDEDNIIQILDKKFSIENYVNHIAVDYHLDRADISDYDYLLKKYRMDGPSIAKTRSLSPQREPLKFYVDGINNLSIGDQDDITNQMISQHLARYSTSLVQIELQTNISALDINPHVGEYLILTHKELLAWFGPEAGIGLPGLPDDDIDESTDTMFNVGDVWAGHDGSPYTGRSSDGTQIIDTTKVEVVAEIFTGNTESFSSTISNFQNWLTRQGA